MSAFSAGWLALREPVDAAARSIGITRFAADALAGRDEVRVVDLASGTGANVRYMTPHLPARQRWLAVDGDGDLLGELPARMRLASGVATDVQIEPRRLDLSRLDTTTIFEGRHLVTASALLDLVSEAWLASLAAHCHRAKATVLFALTYNGRLELSPADSEDSLVRDLVNHHQRTDKGFGAALGPEAPDRAEAEFRARGYDVQRAASDWVLSPAQRDLQQQLIDGWARAAIEMDAEAAAIREWQARRLEHLRAGRSEVLVGHDDLAGRL